MCGICGIFNRPARSGELDRMMDTLRHRGPDDAGQFIDADRLVALGHRRLAIIDLETGRQPIGSEDGAVQVVFNGEIYNYRELRKELEASGHRFRTKTDTEVLVHLYEDHGPELVDKLIGIFAFAIWDSRRRELCLARDRAGVKPLYYHHDPVSRVLVFGSEIKAILASDSFRRAANPEALSRYLTFLYAPGPETFFRNVMQLLPGHLLLARPEGLENRRYWDLAYPADGRAGSVEDFRALFREVVRDQMMSDVPIGSFLSGGLDSGGIVAALASHSVEPLKTYTVGYSAKAAFDESPRAALIGRHVGAAMRRIEQDPADFAAHLGRLAWHLDQPCAGAAAIPLYFVAKLAATEVKVVFSGEGGDELFAGYPRYLLGRLHSLLPRHPLDFAAAYARFGRRWGARISASFLRRYALDEKHFYYRLVNFFSDEDRAQLLSPDFRRQVAASSLHDFSLRFANTGRDVVERLLYVDFKTYLASLLEICDKVTMIHSLETRVPLLDDRIVAFATRLSTADRIGEDEAKGFFKRAVAPWLPPETLTAPKTGFLVPLADWLRGPLAEFGRDLVLSRRSLDRGLFTPARVERFWQEHQSGGRDHSTRLWALMNLELWHRNFLDAA